MAKGIVLMKCAARDRDRVLGALLKLENDRQFSEQTGVVIQEVLAVFGWPDILITMWSKDIGLIKEAVVQIRSIVPDATMETSTIVAVSPREIEMGKLLAFGHKTEPAAGGNPSKAKASLYAGHRAQVEFSLEKIRRQSEDIQKETNEYLVLIKEADEMASARTSLAKKQEV